MTLKEYLDYLIDWLKKQLEVTGAKGYIIGISGGIDSALVAALIQKAGVSNLGVIMPCYSKEEDLKDGIQVCNQLKLKYLIKDLSLPYEELTKGLYSDELDIKIVNASKQNVKVRLRMTTLYALGQAHNYLVIGTDNKAEWHTGYFTKYGDGGVDLVPIIHLSKREVKIASSLLGIPENIINRVPSAGLFDGQTDEMEMKVTYAELDDYLDGKEIPEESKKRIDYLHKISEHKRNLPLQPKGFVK